MSNVRQLVYVRGDNPSYFWDEDTEFRMRMLDNGRWQVEVEIEIVMSGCSVEKFMAELSRISEGLIDARIDSRDIRERYSEERETRTFVSGWQVAKPKQIKAVHKQMKGDKKSA